MTATKVWIAANQKVIQQNNGFALVTPDSFANAGELVLTGTNAAASILTVLGVTAAILLLALNRIGHSRNALYDGSWIEWGAYPDLAVETGS